MSDMMKRKLITIDEYAELVYLVNKPMTISAFEQLRDFFREKQVVRWTAREVMDGTKELPLGKKLKLEEALTHESLVKLDVWAKIQGNRFTEITNFFLFIYVDENGDEHIMNLELGDLIDSFMGDIILYSTTEHKKSMKVAKRMWQLATYIDYDELLNKLYPLFESDVGVLNQIAADIDVIKLMVKNINRPPLAQMIEEIDEFKNRMSTLEEVHLDEKMIYLLIDNIVEHYDRYLNNSDLELIYNNLTHLEGYLLTVVEQYAAQYLDDNSINRDMLISYIKKYRKKMGI